jgi:hypothetical protein
MKLAWCWKCEKEVPMVDETEYRALLTHDADRSVIDEYQRLTGLSLLPGLTTRKLILSHRLSRYGSPCPSCGKPLRTPKATFCAECGHRRPIASGK